MKKNKFKPPENMEDLERRYYGPQRNGRNVDVNKINNYENYLRTKVESPMKEEEVKQFFSPIGKIEKLRRGQEGTYDFKIENKKLLIEVTSINIVLIGEQNEYGNIPINLPANEDAFIERINRCIEHAEKKKGHDGYSKIVVIYYDRSILGLRDDLVKKLFDLEFIRKTTFLSSSIDALMFFPEKVGGNVRPPSPICYVKTLKIAELLGKIKKIEISLLEGNNDTKV